MKRAILFFYSCRNDASQTKKKKELLRLFKNQFGSCVHNIVVTELSKEKGTL